jgi:hypothetical protein
MAFSKRSLVTFTHESPGRSSDGDSELVLATADNYGASSLAAGGADSGARSHVRNVTLDSYVRMEGMSRIDLIKIDIAYTGEAEHRDRPIVNAPIGDRAYSGDREQRVRPIVNAQSAGS